MIKRGMTPTQRRHRLPEQSRIPNLPDIEYLYSEAAKQPGHLIELPWTENRQPYVLTAKLERRNNEQSHQWSFYRGDDQSSKLEWTYESSDVAMIHSLILTSFPADPVPGKPTEPQAQAPRKVVTGVLEGSLNEMPLPSLLTSIQSSRLTGRLSVHSQTDRSDLFFEAGVLVSAHHNEHEGEEAFLEMTLKSGSGEFKFFDADKAPRKTINSHTEGLMLRAAALSDHTKYLALQGLKPDSCLMRTNPNLTEREFEEKLSRLVPVDMNLQKRMYQAVDNKTAFSELLKQCALSRSAWTPLIFNLVSSGICSLDRKDSAREEAQPKQQDQSSSNLTIDLGALEKFTASMTRKDTGIYSEIAFLFFLEHEFYRFHSYETPFSIVLFKFSGKNGALSKQTQKHALDVVKNTVRKADILGHYEGDDYALILPHTQPGAAQGLVNRLHTVLSEPPFQQNEVGLDIGVAGIPEDCQDLITLLRIGLHRKRATA
jgi:hypothetical protein